MEKLRVLHLIKSLGRGGAEMLLPESLRFADRERFEYEYAYFLPWKDALVPALAAQGVGVTCFDARSNAQMLLRVGRVAAHLRRRRIDLVHCHLPVAGAVGRLAGRLAGVPVVYSEHNKQERYHRFTRALNAATWSLQAGVVAVSADVAHSIETYIGARVPTRVILNGVDVDRFDRTTMHAAEAKQRLGVAPDAPVVGTVAVFRTQKRLDHWVEAARAVSAQLPHARFLLVGDGPLRDEVRRAVVAAGIEGAVVLPGLQEDVRPYLLAMDVYMMSSVFEGLPVALLEAMAMSCGVVSTAVGGIPEVVRSGENGLLVAPGDPEALAVAAQTMLRDADLRARLGRAARATVEAGFSMRRMAGELERLYEEVVGRRAAASATRAPLEYGVS